MEDLYDFEFPELNDGKHESFCIRWFAEFLRSIAVWRCK